VQAKGARSSAAIPSYSSVKAGAVQQAHECLYIPLCLYIAKLCRARVQHPLTLPAEPQDLAGQRTMHHHFHSIPHSSSAAACLPCGNMLSSCTAATPRQGC